MGSCCNQFFQWPCIPGSCYRLLGNRQQDALANARDIYIQHIHLYTTVTCIVHNMNHVQSVHMHDTTPALCSEVHGPRQYHSLQAGCTSGLLASGQKRS